MNLQLDPCVSAVQYRAYGLILASDTPLPELAPIARAESAADADVQVRLLGNRQEFPSPSHWFMSWTLPTGDLWLSCAKVHRGYLLRFTELADFFVDSSGRKIICFAGRETPPNTTRHLLLNQVLPLVLNLRGSDALHATAILTPLGVCAFTGPAGTGKSTLAASFLRAGYPILSDDCLVLQNNCGQILATPAYPGLRLWPDAFEALRDDAVMTQPVAHYTSKQRLILERPLSGFPTDRFPLIGIYSLFRPTENEGTTGLLNPLIERLSPRDSFMELIPVAFRFDITDPSMLTRQFWFLERIVSHVPVRRLHLPNAFSSLPAVCEAIIADVTDR